jgi:diguanylate cyclase (GGDEF)-like protein
MDPQSSSHGSSPGGFEWPGPGALDERLSEEIGRAERHGTPLSCLLVVIENLDEMALEHGSELREQTLAYVAAALRRELRGFDRLGTPSDRELLIILPGADSPHAEMVARRVLDRLQAIKVEARGQRRALRVSLGLAAWAEGSGPDALIARARAATMRLNTIEEPSAALGDEPLAHPPSPDSGEGSPSEPPGRRS